MSQAMPLPLHGRDYYTEFVEGSRWLRREQAETRSAWFEGLPWEHKERTVFRFEMLLKGLVCFGNPVNHPGPPRRAEPVVAREFGAEMGAIRQILEVIVEEGRKLSGEEEQSYLFQRYLESVLVQDHARIQIAKESLRQDTPEQSLTLLVAAMENLHEVAGGLSRVASVSYQLFNSVIRLVQREVHRSVYFDPLASLEFSSEFDRIQNIAVLEVIAGIRVDPARRVAALSFLALFRLMKYLDLVSREARAEGDRGPLLAFLSLLRSDSRALAIFLRRDAAGWIADGFGKLYETAEPVSLNERYPRLEGSFEMLKSLRELLGSMGNQLALETRKVYEQQLPALPDVVESADVSREISRATAILGSFLQNAAVLLAGEFAPDIDGEEIFSDYTSDRSRSERLRRDIWMFQQVLRAFVAKARGSADAADRWSGLNTFRFVREFARYFKSMGYQLLRYADYERFDEFMALIEKLRDGDVLEVQRLEHVIGECERFHSFLGRLFEAVGRREDLAGVPFDRKDAARTLKLFLGH